MDPLTIVIEISRGANKLYNVVQQKRYNVKTAQELRKKIFSLEQHVSKHHGNGKNMKKNVSQDVFNWIVTDLKGIKLNMNAINIIARGIFSGYFKSKDIKEQMDDMIMMAELIKMRLENVGMASDTVQNVTEVFDAKINELTDTLRTISETSMDMILAANKESVEVLRKLVKMAEQNKTATKPLEDIQFNVNGANSDTENVLEASGDSSSSVDLDFTEDHDMDVFSRVPEAAMKLMEELTQRGGESEERTKLMEQIGAMWSGW